MNNLTYSYLKKCPSLPSPSGERFKPKHQLRHDGNNKYLVKVGEIDIVQQIGSYEDQVSLAKMIERYKRGDTSVFEGSGGFYGDVSGMETNPQEVINQGRAAMVALQQVEGKDPAATDPAATDPAATDPAVTDPVETNSAAE